MKNSNPHSGPVIFLYSSLFLLISLFPLKANASIPELFNGILNDVQEEYFQIRSSEFESLCTSHGLDSANARNREKFLQIHFLHDLLTTNAARNCAAGGFLEIPYFWHWVEPNPRHSISSVPQGVLLTEVPPPKKYKRYKTFADIGRVPDLFLGDLITETPLYSHPQCGSFFSFGWCSEREMSYTAVMLAWGFPGKIVQEGIHTWSMVWCDYAATDGSIISMEARVDNTFDTVSWQKVATSVKVDQWLKNTGNGSHVDHYNRKARSSVEAEAINSKTASRSARDRILDKVKSAIADER